MNDYILSCESTTDLSIEEFKEMDVSFISYHYTIGGKEYIDDFGQTLPLEEFYKKMAAGEMTHTSQISLGEYLPYFENFLKQGKDILHLTLSSGLSSTYNSACTAASMLLEKYPDRKITIIDSLCASSGFGLLVYRLSNLKKQGLDLDTLALYAQDHKLNVQHWFFSTDLTYYVRGGRVSRTAGFFGNMFHICPLLNVDYQGHLIPREKVRTVRKVEDVQLDKMIQNCDDGVAYDQECFISHSGCPEYGKQVLEKVEATFPNLKGKVKLFPIGSIVGCHAGPGTVALFFFGKTRID
ncbi:MAG: DegV family protein [Bacilli bacterium]